jgi:hypothetical protein
MRMLSNKRVDPNLTATANKYEGEEEEEERMWDVSVTSSPVCQSVRVAYCSVRRGSREIS